jgi:hypothetical protein
MTMLVPVAVFLVATALIAAVGLRFLTAPGADLDRRLQEVVEACARRHPPAAGN